MQIPGAAPEIPSRYVARHWAYGGRLRGYEHRALYAASECFKCGRPLDEVWRVLAPATRFGRNGRPLRGRRLAPFCAECGIEQLRCDPRPYRPEQRCAACKRRIVGPPSRCRDRIVCSDACRAEVLKERRREQREERRYTCACGETFTPSRSDARTCSNRCRQRLHRQRRREAA